MSSCPCGSGAEFSLCCGPIIDGAKAASTAQQLMRARYTAHTLANMAFILKTHHPAKRTDIDEDATAQWAKESEWLGLEIIDVEGGSENDVTPITRWRFSKNTTANGFSKMPKYPRLNNFVVTHPNKDATTRALAAAERNTKNVAVRQHRPPALVIAAPSSSALGGIPWKTNRGSVHTRRACPQK